MIPRSTRKDARLESSLHGRQDRPYMRAKPLCRLLAGPSSPRTLLMPALPCLPQSHRLSFAPQCRNRGCSSSSSPPRSEEHTSELQSRLHLVCRLLLEKKKKTLKTDDTHAALTLC